ncbi:unnamed protein product, partial [Discosporangium mesarthrocarpum]
IRLEIFHCTGLAKADRFGLSDPFCVVFWNGEEVGKTPTIYNALRPQMGVGNTLSMQKEVPFELVVEVWDEDDGVKGDFLGQLRL